MIVSDRISSKIATAMATVNIIPAEEIPLYQYCYSFLLDNIFFSVYVILIGVLSQNPVGGIMILLVLMPLRFLTGGYHANNPLICSVISFSMPPAVLLISFVISFSPTHYSIYILAVSLSILFLFSPVDNINKPISSCKRRKLRNALFVYSIFLVITFTLTIICKAAYCSFLISICVFTSACSVALGLLKNHRFKKLHAHM